MVVGLRKKIETIQTDTQKRKNVRCVCPLFFCMTPTGRNFDVVVLGAGCSGLYAARTLKALNNKLKVLVIEANDYVGGRVKTDEAFAAPLRLPLGAEFIHEYASLLFSIVRYN